MKLWKDFIDLLKVGIVLSLLNELGKFLTPPTAFSWQTLILLSLFSHIMSSLATDFTQNLISSMGWIFLIFGVSWATTDHPPKISGFSLGPWITGALVCTFVFGSWKGDLAPATLVCWPPVSAFLASVREFFDPGLRFRTPPPVSRQNVLLLMLSNLIISCWIQFYFTTQDLLTQYPTLLADDFSKSTFVVKLEVPRTVMSRGALLLNSMEPLVRRELSNKPWPQVERSLLPQELKTRMEVIKKKVQQQLPKAAEDLWWRFTYKVSSIKSGYNLLLQAIWEGPHSEGGNYVIQKSCQITQKPSKKATNSGPISQVTCQG